MLLSDFRGSRRCVGRSPLHVVRTLLEPARRDDVGDCFGLAAALTAGALQPPLVSPIHGGRRGGWQTARCFVALQLFCRLCALMLPLDNASSARVFGCSHSLPIPPSVREKKLISNKLFFSSSLDNSVSVFTLTSLLAKADKACW